MAAVTRIEINGKDFLDVSEVAEHEAVSISTAKRIMKRIEELENEGFYPKWATYRMGARVFRISYLVLRHYMKYADRINERNARKMVPAFDAKEIRDFLGMEKIRHVDL